MTYTAVRRICKVPGYLDALGYNVVNDRIQEIGVYTRTAFATTLIAAPHPTGHTYDRPYQIDADDVLFIDVTFAAWSKE